MLRNMGFGKLYFKIIDRACLCNVFHNRSKIFNAAQRIRYLRADLRILKQVESLFELNWNGSANQMKARHRSATFNYSLLD